MVVITSVTLGVADPVAAKEFHAALGVEAQVGAQDAHAPVPGFGAFILSLVVAQPSTVDKIVEAALGAGGTTLKPASKTFWGYGAVLHGPDGCLWKVATSKKRDTEPASCRIDDLVLLLGVADVKASKRFYVEHGLPVAKSFGGRYAEFEAPADHVKLALYSRPALAKDAGVSLDGASGKRVLIGNDAATFTDADGFRWVRE